MAENDLAYGDQSAGTFTPTQLITADFPPATTSSARVLDGQTLDQWEVVAFDANNKLVVWDPTAVTDIDASGDTANIKAPQAYPVGIMAYAAAPSGADGDGIYYHSGCFNPDLLVWPASIDTLAERKAAFAGTMIQIRELVG